MRYVLDTHTLLWHLGNDPRLGANAKHILDDSNARLIVPVMVLAEAKHAADRKRVSIPFDRVIQEVVASPQITIVGMDILTVNHLSSQLDIHDSIIVATALQCRDSFEEEITLVTNDIAITQSGLIPVIW